MRRYRVTASWDPDEQWDDEDDEDTDYGGQDDPDDDDDDGLEDWEQEQDLED